MLINYFLSWSRFHSFSLASNIFIHVSKFIALNFVSRFKNFPRNIRIISPGGMFLFVWACSSVSTSPRFRVYFVDPAEQKHTSVSIAITGERTVLIPGGCRRVIRVVRERVNDKLIHAEQLVFQVSLYRTKHGLIAFFGGKRGLDSTRSWFRSNGGKKSWTK